MSTLRKNKVSVQDLSRTFEELNSKHAETVDRVILRTRAHRFDKPPTRRISSTDQDYGYKPLDDKTRAWILAAAKNDETKLRSLVNETPQIVGTRDPSTGYTALHWAAKFGNESMIHLLIGRYRMNCNIRTRGGYTPLMLSAMFRVRDANRATILYPQK